MSDTSMIHDADEIARAFVAARQKRRALAAYPGRRPASLVEGYRVQDAALALAGEPVGGWKVGRISPPLDTVHGTDRLAGPIFASAMVAAAEHPVAMPVFAEGFAAAEAEFLLRIGTPPHAGKDDYTAEDAALLIDAVHAGIEIASSPYPDINADGPAVTVSDFGNNNGLLIGPAIPDWRQAILDWRVRLLIDGEAIGEALGRDMLDGPAGAAAFLFNLASRRGIALHPGQWISSGAVTGVHVVKPGQQVLADFDGQAEVRCAITAY